MSAVDGLFKVLGAVLGVFLAFVIGVAVLYFVAYTFIFIFVKSAFS